MAQGRAGAEHVGQTIGAAKAQSFQADIRGQAVKVELHVLIGEITEHARPLTRARPDRLLTHLKTRRDERGQHQHGPRGLAIGARQGRLPPLRGQKLTGFGEVQIIEEQIAVLPRHIGRADRVGVFKITLAIHLIEVQCCGVIPI